MSERSGEPGTVAEGPGLDTFRGGSRIERALLPYLREQTLWPVLVAVLAHVVALVAPLLVLTLRDGHPWAALAVAVFGIATGVGVGFEVRDRRRPGLVSALLAATWLLCGAGAFAGVYYDIL
jgi:hypothetical protein